MLEDIDKFVATMYNHVCSNKDCEVNLMAAMKKGTKLTDTPKDYMLRVRMDNETVEKLDYITDKLKISRSEVVRKGIENLYQSLK